jgi:hypothetical protein
MSAREPGLCLSTTSEGTMTELSAAEAEQKGVTIIYNPFLTKFWAQNPENMTLLPDKKPCNSPRAHSWRRMQLTSPPITTLSISLWYIPPFESPSLNPHCNPLTPPQVHQTRQLRLATPAFHRSRAHGRDSPALCRHARCAASQAGVLLDAAVRVSELAALR